MDAWGYVTLIVGAIAIGLLVQYGLDRRFGYEWIVAALGAGVGGFLASEYSLGGLGKWGTEFFGLAIFPALIGAVIVAAVVGVALHYAERRLATS
jgi:uncharacterized membrane protein YeaQ/YmgE (transglycosylase-associated protein family)